MATNIDKKVTRRCPDILNEDGKPLEVTLHGEESGSLSLRWVGLRRDPSVFRLRQLSDFAEAQEAKIAAGPGAELQADQADQRSTAVEKTGTSSGEPAKHRRGQLDRTGWVRFDDILSKLHIEPMDTGDRERLVAVVKKIQAHWEDTSENE